MVNRFLTISSDFAWRQARQSATLFVVTRDMVNRFIRTAHHTLMLFGVLALGALGIMFVNPSMADQFKAISPFTGEGEIEAKADAAGDAPRIADASDVRLQAFLKQNTQEAQAPRTSHALHSPLAAHDDAAVATPQSKQQQAVTNWLSKRYRVANDATTMLVTAAYSTAREIKLDPLLILSVMAIESGLNPFAESPMGAQGLMQVMSKVHREKFESHGGVKAALNPVANIKVGSMILKDYVNRGGSVEAGLKLYVGAGAMETDFGYGSKVLAEYNRLRDVAMGKQVPIFASNNPPAAAPKPRPQAQEKKQNLSEEGAVLLSDQHEGEILLQAPAAS